MLIFVAQWFFSIICYVEKHHEEYNIFDGYCLLIFINPYCNASHEKLISLVLAVVENPSTSRLFVHCYDKIYIILNNLKWHLFTADLFPLEMTGNICSAIGLLSLLETMSNGRNKEQPVPMVFTEQHCGGPAVVYVGELP